MSFFYIRLYWLIQCSWTTVNLILKCIHYILGEKFKYILNFKSKLVSISFKNKLVLEPKLTCIQPII